VLKCNSCGAALDLTMASCPACGAEVPMGRLTGMLGLVCRHCDAYNEPRARTCVSCGKPLGAVEPGEAETPAAGVPGPAAAAPPPPAAPARPPPPQDPTTGFMAPPAGTRMLPSTPGPAAMAGTAMFVAPVPPPPRARLHLERGEAAPGTVFPLGADEVQAGRSQGAVLFPGDPCLAAHHATFVARGGQVAVRDEGAAGGIFVRIAPGPPVPLRPGGLFAVGDRLLRFAGLLPSPPPPPPDGTVRLGAPRPDGPAVLLEEWLEGGVGGRVWLRAGPSITVGRAGCAVSLGDDPYLSQAHAEIVLDGSGQATLRDLGSSNGTFLRIAPGSEAPLKDGDVVRMGREVLRVEIR